ncbi:MAG: FAD-dependent monooxygenase [Rhizobiaceae bacterium]|nr:FAD-dependent monooxygenase [Rhizobiaceae bacterium]
MDVSRPRQIVIAGAGIAGLTAAIAFARRGFAVRVFEQAPELAEAGAGIQLSPNATRLLDRLGVTEYFLPAAVRPERIALHDARRQRRIAEVPLGEAAEKRWGAPYLVVHRADLQSALKARAARDPDIEIATGARVSDAALHARGVTVSVDRGGAISESMPLLLVGADGVWSSVRAIGSGHHSERFTGEVAWRATLRRDSRAGAALAEIMPADQVSVFLDPRFHLVAYPVRGGSALNLVAIAKGSWNPLAKGPADPAPLEAAMRGVRGPLGTIVKDAGPWTFWPIHEVPAGLAWTARQGAALIGDAAHAMPPYGAQGAAMAIEDAVTLAELVAARPGDLTGALEAYEAARRPRVEQVAKRGRFNKWMWNAGGFVRLGRNMVLARRKPEQLAADLDWIYGFDAMTADAR